MFTLLSLTVSAHCLLAVTATLWWTPAHQVNISGSFEAASNLEFTNGSTPASLQVDNVTVAGVESHGDLSARSSEWYNTHHGSDGTLRCGFYDYSLSGTKWYENTITYSISKYSRQFRPYVVDQVVRTAFNQWAAASKLRFQQRNFGHVDIRINFYTGRHPNSCKPFQNDELGHAFYPPNGNVHINDEIYFTVGNRQGTSLLSVMIHELGHALGLGHSSDPRSVMYADYTGNTRLNGDDINGIQAIYSGYSGGTHHYYEIP